MAKTVKILPAMWETWVQSLGWEDPLEKGMATYPSILAWRIPWTEEPGRLESQGCKELDSSNLAHTAHLHFNPGFCSFTQGVSSYLRLFQRPKSWRIPRRQQSRWDSQPSSFRSVKTASWVGGPLIWYCNNSSC